MSDPRELAIKFITQAVDPAATEQEARTFAFKAAKLIAEHKLLAEPSVSLKEKAASFWKSFPIDRIANGVNTAVLAGTAYELFELKAQNERLKARIRELKERLRRRRHHGGR